MKDYVHFLWQMDLLTFETIQNSSSSLTSIFSLSEFLWRWRLKLTLRIVALKQMTLWNLQNYLLENFNFDFLCTIAFFLVLLFETWEKYTARSNAIRHKQIWSNHDEW